MLTSLGSLRLGASYLGEVPQAVNAIALTLGGLCVQAPLAISQAVSIRIGNLLGANQPNKAKRASEAAQIFTFVIIGITAILLQVVRHSFGYLFSKDPEVVEVFDRMVGLSLQLVVFMGVPSTYTSTGMDGCNGGFLRWYPRRLHGCLERWRSTYYRFPHQHLQLLLCGSARGSCHHHQNAKDRGPLGGIVHSNVRSSRPNAIENTEVGIIWLLPGGS